jgi:hypothetical protein
MVGEAAAEAERWAELNERLGVAVMVLKNLLDDTDDHAERARIRGKMSGVVLALDYMRDYR